MVEITKYYCPGEIKYMEEYILFADETNPSLHNPYFCFAGAIIERKYYEETLITKINFLKMKYFNRTDVVFHFTDMKKNKKDFSIFQNDSIRLSFWSEYVELLKNINMEVIGVFYNPNDMKTLYPNNSHSTYDIGFCGLIDNFMHYLKTKNAYGQITIESRTFKENGYLQKTFFEYVNSGSLYFSSNDTNKYLTSIGFIPKGDNCIGLQIADIIPSQLLRQNIKKDFFGLSKALCSKVYNVGTSYEHILGVKNLL